MKSILLTLTAFMLFTQAFANDTTKAGQKLPSVKVKTLDGEEVDIKTVGEKGKIVIISFWATWCAPCIKELDNMADLYEQWQKDYDLEIIAVTIDDSRNIPRVKPFVNGKGWPYTILIDENKDLARALNVNNPPQTFLLDKEGNIVYTHVSYKEGDEFELENNIKKIKK